MNENIKRNRKMVANILGIALGATVILALVLVIMGSVNVRSAYVSAYETGLKAACEQLDSQFSYEWDGDWAYEGGVLTKGGQPVYDEYKSQMEELKNETGLEYTIFYGDTRVISTLVENGQSMEGTTASGAVVDKVINKGEEYMVENVDIGGEKFFAYYCPLENSDGSVVGMAFAGDSAEEINSHINRTVIIMTVVAVAIVLVILFIGLYMLKTTTVAIKDIVGGLNRMAQGDLSFKFTQQTLARKDELGVIAENMRGLREKLRDVITNTLNLSGEVSKSGNELSSSAEMATQASGQVTDAVDDISKGAVSQAESVQDSANNTGEMGDNIDGITMSVEELSESAKEMMAASNRTVEALDKVLRQNEEVKVSMQEIESQIRATNDAVKEIADASNVINDISSQTNLLALNASIEAARAGEAGKGFAVVATEIGSLADQSGNAAVSIKNIVDNLVAESEKSVETIGHLNEGIQAQNEQLNSTKGDMDGMVENVDNVSSGAHMIAEKIQMLNASKESLNSIISDLSAVSQENAAATEETNASMEELNATFEVINDSANELKNLAVQLNEEINFFTLESTEEE